MWDRVGEFARPLMAAMGDWSLRWALLIGLLAAWFALRPPRRASLRYLMGLAALAAGLLLPAIPRWGQGFVAANSPPAGREMVAPAAKTIAAGPMSPMVQAEVPAPAPDAGLPPSPAPSPVRAGLPSAWTVTLGIWSLGAAVALARLALGIRHGGRLGREATPAADRHLAELEECRGLIPGARPARLLLHPSIDSPAVLVGHRPTILVPSDWGNWPERDRRAALLHELAHLARGDDWQRLGQEFVRAAFWFHPAVHWLLGRIDHERELLCDEMVVRRGVPPTTLAEILLDACRRARRPIADAKPRAAIPFFSTKTTKRRILRLLEAGADPLPAPLPARAAVAAGFAAGLALLAVGSVEVFAAASPPSPEQGESPMPPKPPEDPEKAEPTPSRHPSLQGRITDTDGKPLPGARVILYAGFATRMKAGEAVTDADGRYRFDEVRSSMIKNEKEDRWDQYVGIRVEHPTHIEADGHSWRDITIPGIPGHTETLDLQLTKGGYLACTLKDARTGEPLKGLDLRVSQPTDARGHGVTFSAYARTDNKGEFRTIALFPGEYDIEANSSTMGYPLIGRFRVEPGMTSSVTFDAVQLPKVIEGRVLDAGDKPVGDVEVTLLDPKDSGIVPRGEGDYSKVRTRAWAITRDDAGKFELAFLPGLEQSRFALAIHKALGWARVPVEDIEQGKPIRLQPWEK